MRGSMKKFFILVLPIFVLFGFISCYTPSPLYGSWADNDGNKITFVSDGTFVAKIVKSSDESQKNESITYQGSYVVIDNVIVFATDSGITVNTEWDIRGAMMYLTWTAEGITKNLALYHTSK